MLTGRRTMLPFGWH